jgi:hypothetical protein
VALVAVATAGLAFTGSAQSGPLLQLQGTPYSQGAVTLHLFGEVGAPTLLFYGLDPLDPPLPTTKGPFHVGSVLNALPLGPVPALGRIDLSVALPPLDPVLAGIPLVLQGFMPGVLTNPATLPLDQPYHVPADAIQLVSPNPTVLGSFGDRFATGDLDDDGAMDVVVAAGKEHANGVSESGRVYVFWGPDLASPMVLESPAPKVKGFFGVGLAVGDFDGDGIDDLLVTEGTGTPALTPTGTAHVFRGGAGFSGTPESGVASAGSGTAYTQYGHELVAADFDDDGFCDFATGVDRAVVQGFDKAGQIEVHWGPDFSRHDVLIAPTVEQNGFFGERLGLGDIDGDGVQDLVVGNPRKAVGGTLSMGEVHLLQGPSLLHVKTLSHPLPSGLNSRFGNAVLGEDLDGDGVDEIIATDQRNHAFIFWSPYFDDHAVITRPPDPVTGSTASSVSFGYFATSGDVNGDGWGDVIVGEPFLLRVHVALGPFWSSVHLLQDPFQTSFSEFGWGMRVVDLDGDGRKELLVGSNTADPNGVAQAGRVVIFDFNP